MVDIISYCDKTLKNRNNSNASTEVLLKDTVEQEGYVRVQFTIKKNAEATKWQFKQRKT